MKATAKKTAAPKKAAPVNSKAPLEHSVATAPAAVSPSKPIKRQIMRCPLFLAPAARPLLATRPRPRATGPLPTRARAPTRHWLAARPFAPLARHLAALTRR